MKYFKILGLCLGVVFIMSALAASAAQAEENKGPLWIVGSGGTQLKEGETRAITSRSETPFVLHGSLASVTCAKETDAGFLLGGNPGTDYSKIKFEECTLVGHASCKAEGVRPLKAKLGEIIVDTLTVLAYAKGSRESALDAFAPEGEPGHENLFVEFVFEKSVANCGVFSGIKVEVNAVGTEIKIKNEARKCGQLGQVGRTEGGVFKLTKPGETATVGLQRLAPEEKPIKEAEWFNSATGKYEVIKCELEAKGLGEAFEIGTAIVETEPAAPYGWDS